MTIDPPGDSLTLSGRPAGPSLLAPEAGDDRRRVYYYSVFPNLLLTLLPDYAMCHTLWPVAVDRTRIVCEWLFAPEVAADGKACRMRWRSGTARTGRTGACASWPSRA